ncbi:DNA cytosine methyltransferase [Prevotellamassilia timonensis]|uniref:DNA cytosine methyltransferase n=1 Tax=Prevotellamassilia timonensis TaxID=1852370 RepID=UPI003FEFCD30
MEAQIAEWEEQLKDYEPHNYLYTVEIPDDNGGNYLDWNGPVPAETIDRITEYLREKYGDEVVNGRWLSNPLLSSKGVDVSARNGAAIYRQLERALGSDKKASLALAELGYAGIKYPAEFRSGGRKDDAKNYVIFNENDAEITDHVRFFKTKNGEAYGFTVGGKIYYDPRIANAETPVHEYAHLWASALKANNAKEWNNVVDLMKGTNVWEEVKKTYPELETDDEIADEVLATYSGRRGAERLREEMRKAAAEGDGVMGKAEAVSALQRVKRAIDRFWKAVADFLHIHYTSAEEVADRVMKDLLDGVDPRSMMDGGKSLRPETRVNVVEAEAGHGFKNYAEAKTWAKEHIARTYSGEETGGKGDIRISNAAVDKYLSQSAVDKSESKDVHLAVLKVLPDVIRESVDAEQHADFKKGKDGVRSAENGINPDVTIHRLYGAVRMDGKVYRVKVTLKEDTQNEELAKKAYSYEATKIELLAGTLVKPEDDDPNTNNSITAAKLLNGVEKSYDGGKFFEDYNKIREQFIGEKGAAAADHADEVSTRLDNLGVAREMEAEKKDAKAIKMATGWERGADGKWRYEMPDAKIKETMDIDGHVVKRFDEDMLWNDGKLADVVDAPELFKAYPQLKGTRIVTDAVTGDMPSTGDYNAKTNTITIHADELKYMNGILNHEVQHAIQKIEGFARGGSPAMVRSEIKKQMAEVTKQIRQLRAEGKEAEAKKLIKKNRGLYEASVGDDDFGSYKSLAGEVESRNVESRMGMSAEERRASLAVETEDVSREDQIFLTSGDGGRSYSLKDGSFLRSGSYFSGGGLLEEGLKDYLDPKVAVEFNEKISGVYRDNFGNHIVTADVRDVDPKKLVKDIDGPVQYFHASPVCKNFSTAKRDGGEVELDKETARSTAQFIGETRPKVVTIENVKGYKNSDALKIITDELTAQGYDWDMGVYNAADYGGYTNRERLIVRAVRDGKLPPKPEALPEGERKGGWIEAVSDLIDGLPEKKSGVPKWVDERLKGEGIDYRHIDKPLYVFGQGNSRTSIPHAFADELLPTLRTKGGDMIIMPDGRVLKVTPRVLARVTGLADDYEMPETDDLAHTVVGNGIPTQLSEHVIGPLLADVFNGGEPARKDGSAHLGRGNVAGEMGAAEDYTAFASRYGVSADMVKDYALGMKTGNLQKANFALAEIRRTMRVANRGMKLSEFGKLFRPVQKELAERYGDIEVLRQEYIDAEMRERGVMEAARKRAEEEAAERKARADELRLLPEEELDRRYFEAVERGDDAAAREMLDEAARRKGYGDTESEYQGVGAWVAPSNPGYESDAARRADVEDNAPDVNVEDIALGYSLVDENYWHEPRKYMQTDATAVESVNAINDAMAAIRRGEKDVKVKVYRAVPSSVKEGKLRNGDWVTPSRAYAKMHGEHRLGGDYRIIEDEVPVNELWWDGNDSREWGFDDGKGYKYKNVENSRKLNDLVTRDDNGEIIAPSKRFDENVEDVRYRTSEELGQEYGSRWIDEQTNEDGRHTTQVKNTLNSYKKFGDWVMRDSGGKKVDVLDASSGLGLGTEWLRKNGIDAEDVEPYPSENRTAPTYRNYDEVGKKYDYIISNAVLNVIPDDWRASVLHNMADKLKVGGKLVVNVRSAESIRKQGKEGETRITLDDPSEILVLRPNGSIKAYQKGFTKAELKEWCEKELGKGYSVEIANDKNAGGSYDTAVVVTKNNESGTIGVASEAGRPRRSAQALPSSNAKLDNNQKFANNLLVLSENLSERDMGAHEFLFNVAKAFGLNGQNLNKSFYQDLSNSVGIRISDHSANTDNITNRNVNDDVYGLVVKLSKNRFKSRSDANYLEYVYYPDKLTGERQREIVEGLNKFLQTGDYMQLPAPDRVNRSGKFDVLIDGRETSPTAKHQAANDLARQMHVEGEVEVVTSTEGLTGRQAKAKGWYDVRTGKVTIVLPNNKNAADVRETVFHEVVAHKGLRNLVGEEHFNTFLDNVYNNAEEGIKQTIDEMAEKRYKGDKRKATEEYMAHLAEDGEFVKPENQGFFAKVRNFLTDLLRKVGIKLGFKLTDNDLRYILWRSWKGLAERDGGSVFEKAEDVKMQHELGQTDEARSASGENGIMFREGSDELKDVVEKMKADVERLHEGELDDLRSGARAIGGRLSELNKAMRLQRAYDMSTVASVTELAKTMLKNGLLSEMSDYDVRRLLSVVNNVHGKGDIRPYVQKVVDMMVGNRLRNVSKAFDKLLAMRGKKVDARGVEVQGELDLAGQRMADVVWKGIGMSDDDVADMCADAQDRMMSANGAEAAAAATDYAGWQIVMRYNETIRDSKSEEVRLREDLKRAKEDYDAGRMTHEAYIEFRESTNDAIRENRIERAEAYEELYEQLGGAYGESIKRAADFKAAEKARVLEIQHNANSNMEGRPARSYRKDTAVDKVLNSSPVQLLFAPLGTFDQMLRMFGSKNVKGEGYLWNRYMRGWLTATENEYTGYRDATAELDAKAAEVLGKGKTWADLFALERKLPKATVRVWDNGEMRELELPQGNLLYIYMVDKMADGRMKLRKMGVTEDDVAAIEDFLDPRLKEIGDWLQEVYLVEKRGKYNEVHERMFGAAMASIDNYFPLKILKDARAENVDVGVEKRESEMASTITGSVVKRTRNALALDLLNSDAFSVVLDHLQQMEHWSAFAEWNRDLNTLLSYKHFRNQVKNMRSAYGSGERLWEAFDKVARIAAGTYTPPKAFADKLAVNIAKGVTAAKISLRVFTALKQFTSFPAYLSDSNPVYLLKGVANPYGSWKWCMENLPLFEKRWKSRMAGDPRLLKNEMDWSLWRDNVVQMAAKWGMTPNGFVDALTVCIGARAMYETRRRKYIRYGYGLEEAERRAKQDASILYNQTQQSSEGAFLSALQVDRSWYSVLFTVFRNSSMSYTRQLYAALRNTGRRIAGGAKFKGISEAFMAKQMERDGIDPDKASKNAKAEYRKSWINDLVRAGVFGYVLQLAWNCGPYALYMLFGDDEKKGKEMWHDIWTHTAFGSVEGLTGGDVWSAGLQSLWNHYVNGEDFNANSVNKDMPLTSDLLNVVKKVGSDNYGALNDVLNLLVQAGFGVNPQTLTDAAVAIYDYCGSDVETTKECALLVMRVMNCPQSQMDNIYFDEIDATGEEAKAMSVEEIAERYARYKALRSAPLRALSSDALKAAEKKPRERVMTEAKEQLDGRLMTEEAQRYLDEYEATKKKVTETRALADTAPKAFMQQMPALARSGEFRRYRRVGLYKSEVNKLTKKLLRTSDPAERRALFGKMLDARDKMLKQVREME